MVETRARRRVLPDLQRAPPRADPDPGPGAPRLRPHRPRGPDAAALDAARTPPARGRSATLLGDVYDGEPGIDRALRVQAPGGHVFKLFCGMETARCWSHGDRPLKFEHASVKTPRPKPLERFLTDGLGFRFSDRMGALASWWHCDADHHGMAITLAPRNELSHYAYSIEDLNAAGRVADRLKANARPATHLGPVAPRPGQQPLRVLPRQRRRDDRALLRPRPDAARRRLPAAQLAERRRAVNQWAAPPPRSRSTGVPRSASRRRSSAVVRDGCRAPQEKTTNNPPTERQNARERNTTNQRRKRRGAERGKQPREPGGGEERWMPETKEKENGGEGEEGEEGGGDGTHLG